MDLLKLSLVCFLILLSVSPNVQGYSADEVSVFVSPDSSYEGFTSFIDSVDSFLYFSVYQISSPLVADEISELLDEGKNVTILVEHSPAGGFSKDQKGILSQLVEKGAQVYVSGSEFRFNHGKYGVSDNDTLFLTTENLGLNGFPLSGMRGNRGWGAVMHGTGLAEYFASVFYRDLEDSEPFNIVDISINLSTDTSTYSPEFGVKKYVGNFIVGPVLAPDNAVPMIVSLLDSANVSIDIEQFYIYTYWGRRKTGSVEETPNLFLEVRLVRIN